MENNLKISVVIPVYNEEGAVKDVIGQVKKEMAKTGCEYEIIAVNDASKDSSKAILEGIGGIKVFSHVFNKGYGASLKTGIKKSRFERVLIIDADGTYPAAAIGGLLARAADYDLVVGSREKKDNAIPVNRKHAKKFLNRYASYLAGVKIPDLNSGLRVFKKEIVEKYWELFPERFSFTSTLTMVCLTHGYDTKFVPIDYYKRTGKSSIRPKDFLNFLKLVTKLSLFFKPIKVFTPLSLIILLAAALIPLLYWYNITERFLDSTFIILCATALQTFFFGLLAEIVIHNK